MANHPPVAANVGAEIPKDILYPWRREGSNRDDRGDRGDRDDRGDIQRRKPYLQLFNYVSLFVSLSRQ
jgi:hypothetical protein